MPEYYPRNEILTPKWVTPPAKKPIWPYVLVVTLALAAGAIAIWWFFVR